MQDWIAWSLSPPQIMGIEVEDALCSIFMHRAPVVDSLEELTNWLGGLIEEFTRKALKSGLEIFEEAYVEKKANFFEYFDEESISKLLENGVTLQLEEVKKCYDAGGICSF